MTDRRRRSTIDQIEFMRNVLAFSLVGAFIGAMGAFTFFVIPPTNKDILTYMVGQLSGMAIMALGFYFVNKAGQDALDAQRADNTGKALDVAGKAADTKSIAGGDVIRPGDDVTINKAEPNHEEDTPRI